MADLAARVWRLLKGSRAQGGMWVEPVRDDRCWRCGAPGDGTACAGCVAWLNGESENDPKEHLWEQ